MGKILRFDGHAMGIYGVIIYNQYTLLPFVLTKMLFLHNLGVFTGFYNFWEVFGGSIGIYWNG
jgi:hypothetical protein